MLIFQDMLGQLSMLALKMGFNHYSTEIYISIHISICIASSAINRIYKCEISGGVTHCPSPMKGKTAT